MRFFRGRNAHGAADGSCAAAESLRRRRSGADALKEKSGREDTARQPKHACVRR